MDDRWVDRLAVAHHAAEVREAIKQAAVTLAVAIVAGSVIAQGKQVSDEDLARMVSDARRAWDAAGKNGQ